MTKLGKYFLTILLGSGIISDLTASNHTEFAEVFNDSTLRMDYVFGGGPEGVTILLDRQTKLPGWAGRKHRLKETCLDGYATITVSDPETGKILYTNPFSTLFQEWLTTPESETESRSFENSVTVPLPKQPADITVSLRNNRHQEIGKLTHRYRPDDILIRVSGRDPLPHKYLHKGNNGDATIDVAIVAEGYTESEMDKFLEKAEIFSNEILSYEPFASNKEKFNFVAVMTPSKESGVSIPARGEWKETAFDSHFSTFYSDRYLTTPRVWRIHQQLEGIPYEHILIVVNTDEYGGGGIYNNYQIASAENEYTLPVTVHEFGHSFAGLADEYFYEGEEDDTYPLDIEPWEGNITTNVDFSSKWADMINEGTGIGMFEGGGYKTKGVFRPTENCRMRTNKYPSFCPVCERIISEVIEFYTE